MPKFLVSHDEKNFYVVYELTQMVKNLQTPITIFSDGCLF